MTTRRCPRCTADATCGLCAAAREYRETNADADPIGRMVGKTVRRLRKERGMSQADVADQLNMPRPSIARLERGKHCPTLELLVDVACVLGVRPSALIASVDAACAAVANTTPTEKETVR